LSIFKSALTILSAGVSIIHCVTMRIAASLCSVNVDIHWLYGPMLAPGL